MVNYEIYVSVAGKVEENKEIRSGVHTCTSLTLAINQNEILQYGYYQSFPKNVFEVLMKSTNS